MRILALALCAAMVGCGGQYVLTAPDQVACAGGQTATVIRLQRHQFAGMLASSSGAAMRFQVEGCPLRGAFADNLGYAGAAVPAPDKPGVYKMKISHLNRDGDEIESQVPLYVWQADWPVVAVDLEALDAAKKRDDSKAALQKIAREANIIYFTRRQVTEHADIHRRLTAGGYPDGPVLLWQSQRWHIVQDKYPRLVIESKLISQLSHLRDVFGRLSVGITDQDDGARALAAVHMKIVFLGDEKPHAANVTHRKDWADLAANGL